MYAEPFRIQRIDFDPPGHRSSVPVLEQAPCRQHKRVLVIGEFRCRLMMH
jgi:hypothetical protein